MHKAKSWIQWVPRTQKNILQSFLSLSALPLLCTISELLVFYSSNLPFDLHFISAPVSPPALCLWLQELSAISHFLSTRSVVLCLFLITSDSNWSSRLSPGSHLNHSSVGVTPAVSSPVSCIHFEPVQWWLYIKGDLVNMCCCWVASIDMTIYLSQCAYCMSKLRTMWLSKFAKNSMEFPTTFLGALPHFILRKGYSFVWLLAQIQIQK